jgi:hypothetical protein
MRLVVCVLALLAGMGPRALAQEWSSPRWCGPDRLAKLMEQYEPKEADASPDMCSSVVCVKFSKLVVVAGVGSFQVNSDIPLFDRQDRPFAPTCPRAERRAQRQSRMPQAPAEPARSVLDQASAVLS